MSDYSSCLLFSENYIFGKFDAFCKRLEKLDDMLTTIDDLSKLPDVKIEVCDGWKCLKK